MFVIPPAVAVRAIAASVSPWVLVATIVSEVPTLVVKLIALVVSSFEEIATWPPAISTSLPIAASISTPPTVEVRVIASSPVPRPFVRVIVLLVGVGSPLKIRLFTAVPSSSVIIKFFELLKSLINWHFLQKV